jgi:hypothetical protein
MPKPISQQRTGFHSMQSGNVVAAGARLCFHDDAKPIEIDT